MDSQNDTVPAARNAERVKNVCPGCGDRVRRDYVEKNGDCPSCGKLIKLEDLA